MAGPHVLVQRLFQHPAGSLSVVQRGSGSPPMSHFDEAPPDEPAKTDPHASPAPSEPPPAAGLGLGAFVMPAGGIVRNAEEAFVLYTSEVAAGQRQSVALGMFLIELAELEVSNPEGFRELAGAQPLPTEIRRTAELIESMPSLTVFFRCLAAGFDYAIGYAPTPGSPPLTLDDAAALAPAHRCFRALVAGLVDVVARLEADVI